MPSGKRIDWSEHDELLRTKLPNHTIRDFVKKYLPDISTKAVGSRAKKLGVIPAPKLISCKHKIAISNAHSKISPELVSLLKTNYGGMTMTELSKISGVSIPTIYTIIKKYNIQKVTTPLAPTNALLTKSNWIDWSQYDDIIRNELPHCTIIDLSQKLGISDKSLGKRAKKLQVECLKYKPTTEHKKKIADTASVSWSDGDISELLHLIPTKSLQELSPILDKHPSNIWRKLQELNYTHDNTETTTKHSRRVCEALSSPEVRAKLSANAIGRVLSDEQKNKISESIKLLWQDDKYRSMYIEKRNSPETIAKLAIALANQPRISSIQHKLYSILRDLDIEHCEESQDTRVGYYVFDCKIIRNGLPDLLVECQGDYWHTLPGAAGRDRSKFTYIDRYFKDEYEIMYIWESEFEDEERLLDRLKCKLGLETDVVDYSFSDLKISEASRSDIKSFLDAYHYLGSNRSGKAYIVKLDNETVAVILFSPPVRQNLRDHIELSRFCIHPRYRKKNLASWFISRVVKNFDTTIRAYADTTIGHLGTIYKAANFEYSHDTKPDYWYIELSTGHIRRKKSLYNEARGLGMKEAEYAKKFGYAKKYGGKKICYTYEPQNH